MRHLLRALLLARFVLGAYLSAAPKGVGVKTPPAHFQRVHDDTLNVDAADADEEHTAAVQQALGLGPTAREEEQCQDMSEAVAFAAPLERQPPAGRWSKTSELLECQATAGPRADPLFLQKVRPCGNYSSICHDIPLVQANTDYPGGGVGNVVPGQDYIVQFDVGVHPVVAEEILKRRLKGINTCVSCPTFEEKCLEVVVTGGASWGDLGLTSLGRRSYDCMGGCGKGCVAPTILNKWDGGALDCLKHDVCSAWKSVFQGRPATGFCNDPDCGDEAAMTIFNCWRGWRIFGSLGSGASGPFSTPAVCAQDQSTRGCWSHAGWMTEGRCKIFQGWSRGQGIPDPHPLRSPIQRL